MSRRTHSLNAYEVALTSAVGDSSLTFQVETTVGLTVPLYLVIDPDDPLKREYFKVTSINGNNLEVGTISNRGLLGTTGGPPMSHDTGAKVRAVAVSQWLDDIFNDVEDLELWDSNHVAAADAHPQYVKQAGDAMNGYLSVYANPAQDLHAVPKQYLEAQLALAVPAGVISPFGGTAAPSGYLLCDGAAISRTTYATLFAVIGESYGAGDGSTTFLVPDLRGRFALGKADSGTGAVLGESGGELDPEIYLGGANMEIVDSHSHGVIGDTGVYNDFYWATDLQAGTAQHIPRSDHTHSVAFDSQLSGSHNHNMLGSIPGFNPAYQVVNHIVKY